MVLLDVFMPHIYGWQTCRHIREVSNVPILILTGYSHTEDDIVRGLDYGADEYVIKPISNRELAARVRAVLRRAELTLSKETTTTGIYVDDRLFVNIAERQVLVEGKRVRLTPIEFRLFAQLVHSADRILTHQQLLEKVWGCDLPPLLVPAARW